MPVGLHPVAFWAAAQAGVCMEGGGNLPQGIVAPCRADQRDAEGQDGLRVAGRRQVLRALSHLACSAGLRVKNDSLPYWQWVCSSSMYPVALPWMLHARLARLAHPHHQVLHER